MVDFIQSNEVDGFRSAFLRYEHVFESRHTTGLVNIHFVVMTKVLDEFGGDLLGCLEAHAIDVCMSDILIGDFSAYLADQCTLARSRRTTNIEAATGLRCNACLDKGVEHCAFFVASNQASRVCTPGKQLASRVENGGSIRWS